jgi:hypothetical protein
MLHDYPADFVSGAIAMAYLVVALFFVRFWHRTRDALFMIFSVAFALLAASATAFALAGAGREEGWIYLFRLAAFTLIIVAILGKNRPQR